jgi:hypothetical protein
LLIEIIQLAIGDPNLYIRNLALMIRPVIGGGNIDLSVLDQVPYVTKFKHSLETGRNFSFNIVRDASLQLIPSQCLYLSNNSISEVQKGGFVLKPIIQFKDEYSPPSLKKRYEIYGIASSISVSPVSSIYLLRFSAAIVNSSITT